MQEIAAAVYRGRHYFDPARGRPMAWLGRMAVHTAFAVRESAGAAKRLRPEPPNRPTEVIDQPPQAISGR